MRTSDSIQVPPVGEGIDFTHSTWSPSNTNARCEIVRGVLTTVESIICRCTRRPDGPQSVYSNINVYLYIYIHIYMTQTHYHAVCIHTYLRDDGLECRVFVFECASALTGC